MEGVSGDTGLSGSYCGDGGSVVFGVVGSYCGDEGSEVFGVVDLALAGGNGRVLAVTGCELPLSSAVELLAAAGVVLV